MGRRRTLPVEEPDQFAAEEEVEVTSTIPLSVRRSLREVLGDEGERVEEVWLEALASDNERIKVEAAKVLTQAAVQLSKGGVGDSAKLLIPKRVEDVELLGLDEAYAALAAIYVTELEGYRRKYDDDDAVGHFLEAHPNIEVPLALLKRALAEAP